MEKVRIRSQSPQRDVAYEEEEEEEMKTKRRRAL
jgi:hypothetical protein